MWNEGLDVGSVNVQVHKWDRLIGLAQTQYLKIVDSTSNSNSHCNMSNSNSEENWQEVQIKKNEKAYLKYFVNEWPSAQSFSKFTQSLGKD